MTTVDSRSAATAYASKDNILVPAELVPTDAHLEALAESARQRKADAGEYVKSVELPPVG